METVFNKKVLAVLLQWDYGIAARGDSLEKTCFLETLKKLVTTVDVLWYDNYLQNLIDLQKFVLSKAESLKPDLIFFVPYAEQFTIETLDILKKKYTTFSFFGDDRWRFDSFTKKYAPYFTFVSTTDPYSVPSYRKLGINPIVSQWAAQPYSELKGPLTEGEPYDHSVSFIGQHNSTRQWFINGLKAEGIEVNCFGSGWPNGRVSFTEMESIFRKSKINLNLSNSVSRDIGYIVGGLKNFKDFLRSKKRVEQSKARNFEIPLAGGFQLCHYFPGLERYLHIGEEIAVFASIEDCVIQIKYFLDHNDERRKIALRGFERVKNEHTYEHRLISILNRIFMR